MARLRHMTFFTLAEVNQAIRLLLKDLNQRPFQKLPGSRLSQFELMVKPVMRALPLTRYEYIEFKLVRVNIDYHIEYDKHFYSAPHHLVKHQVEVQDTRDGVALFFKGKQIARHARRYAQGTFSTESSHMPEAHRKQQEWTPERLRRSLRLSPLPLSDEQFPLTPKILGKGPVSSTRQIRHIAQDCFDDAYTRMKNDGLEDDAADLRTATVHWLRHTGISEDVKFRPREHVRDDAGHASMATTDRYIDSDLRERHASGKRKRIREIY